jgi:hypothetical protein
MREKDTAKKKVAKHKTQIPPPKSKTQKPAN